MKRRDFLKIAGSGAMMTPLASMPAFAEKTNVKLACRRESSVPLLSANKIAWPDGHGDGNIMFPSVVDSPRESEGAGEHLRIYYASHGGKTICLATAPGPRGPWQPIDGNPVFRLQDSNSVRGHISSPHVVEADDGTFLLYFHGTNPVGVHGQGTGISRSPDGLSFTAIDSKGLVFATPSDHWGCECACYARVLEGRDGFHAFFTAELRAECKKWSRTCLEHAKSQDDVHWQRQSPEALLTSPVIDGKMHRIRHCGACWVDDGAVLLLYSIRRGKTESIEAVLLKEDGDSFTVSERFGRILKPELSWERRDLRDPCPFVLNGEIWLYYVGGGERHIGLA